MEKLADDQVVLENNFTQKCRVFGSKTLRLLATLREISTNSEIDTVTHHT
uniref:Uncharacterized protein n=1 Tax=Arion vulgaris TaxID=1028688 RepID=A0A0B7AIA6_9EUPU